MTTIHTRQVHRYTCPN